ncbi:MAG: sugar kinase [Ignavibacteriales bacterium]|nr:MAG: sugar kinase [Ignavibacteriales bacterium]
MSLLVIGSLAFDTVITPFAKADNALGGSAVYVSVAASYFTKPIYLVGVVGDDFKEEHVKLLKDHNVDIEGLQIIENGKTFRWGGKYHDDMNNRDTLFTELNVFQDFDPVIPENYKKSEYVLLGNIDPTLQLRVLKQIISPKFIVCDTMNLWIDIKNAELLEVIKQVHVLIINDSEARLITKEPNLIKAAKMIMKMGPEFLIIKKGEHGALLFSKDKIFSAPAYPLENIYDPTGAGDTFAGGFIGYMQKTQDLSFENMKKAVIYGSALASFCVEHLSTKGIENLTQTKIQERFKEFLSLTECSDDEK